LRLLKAIKKFEISVKLCRALRCGYLSHKHLLIRTSVFVCGPFFEITRKNVGPMVPCFQGAKGKNSIVFHTRRAKNFYMVEFLASDKANYVAGRTLFLDGGMTLYPTFDFTFHPGEK